MLRTRIFGGLIAGLVLAFVFSAFSTAIWSFELFAHRDAPRFGEVTPFTLRVPYSPQLFQQIASSTPPSHVSSAKDVDVTRARLEYRRIIIPRGTLLREDLEAHRIALTYEATRRPLTPLRIGGGALLYFTLSTLLATYARRFGPSAAKLLRTQIGLFVLLLATMIFAKALLLYTALPEQWVPLSTVPLWACLYLDRRTAFIVNVLLGFCAASLLRFDILFLIVLLVRGMVSSLAFRDRKHPRRMLLAGSIAGAAGAVLWCATTLSLDGALPVRADLALGLDSVLFACVGGGVLAGALAVFLREPAERLLGAVGRDRLLDLTDLEQPLLQKMSREAPGSWEHCRAMANLAEAAASAIGADALLVRCGAYYHDLGKTVQPKYFVENLLHGERSPHEELEPDVSADAIMTHVVQGTKILRDGGIPEPVVEFAYTHHGTQVVEYFWHKCQEQGNPKGLTEEHFRYPGMKPRTKEHAILMLVDSIEAASRTVDPPEKKKFEEMMQRIIFMKLKSGQLSECGLSTRDLQNLVLRMGETLENMFHTRVKYPWQKEKEKEARAATPAQGTGGNVVRLPSRGPEK